MAYIGYDQKTVGGTQVAEVYAQLRDVNSRMQALALWIGQIGPANLEGHADFMVDAGQGQGFNDTFIEVATALDDLLTLKEEQIARLARGS